MAYHVAQPSSDDIAPSKGDKHTAKMPPLERPKSPNAVLKRSCSTPDTAKLQKVDAEESHSQQTAAAEKKRNKLGYHRTSIACSHCRRRKIRCIASPDIANRCVNCIRLKKECSFYPVDQQPGMDPRSKPQSRHNGGHNTSSTSSSPANGTVSPAETPSVQAGGGVSGSGPLGTSSDYFSPDRGVSSNGLPPGNQYTFADQHPPGWMSAELTSTGASKSEDMTMQWHAYTNEAPMSGQYSPYTQTTSASVAWTSETSEAGSHDEMPWGEFPSQMRSLSYSGESSGNPQASYIHMAQPQPYEGRHSSFSTVYPHFATTMAGLSANPLAPGETPAQIGGGAPFAPDVNTWQSQHILSSQGQPESWHYGAPNEGENMLIDDQEPVPGATQTPSGIYYSS